MSIQGYGRSAQEKKEYLEALWPGTETLKNKWGLLDEEELLIAERHAVSQRVEGGLLVSMLTGRLRPSPLRCQGICQSPAPFSIAAMMLLVTCV